MLGRLALFLIVVAFVEVPLKIIDWDDGLVMRMFVKVFLPTAIEGCVLFAFMDQLFFRLKLYDPDTQNTEIVGANQNPFTDYLVEGGAGANPFVSRTDKNFSLQEEERDLLDSTEH